MASVLIDNVVDLLWPHIPVNFISIICENLPNFNPAKYGRKMLGLLMYLEKLPELQDKLARNNKIIHSYKEGMLIKPIKIVSFCFEISSFF